MEPYFEMMKELDIKRKLMLIKEKKFIEEENKHPLDESLVSMNRGGDFITPKQSQPYN